MWSLGAARPAGGPYGRSQPAHGAPWARGPVQAVRYYLRMPPPLSVRLSGDDLKLLDDLAGRLLCSRSDVLRRGLRQLVADVPPTPDDRPDVADEYEVLALLSKKARQGHVGACVALQRHLEKAEPDAPKPQNPFSLVLDDGDDA